MPTTAGISESTLFVGVGGQVKKVVATVLAGLWFLTPFLGDSPKKSGADAKPQSAATQPVAAAATPPAAASTPASV
ncbi:hypothetical protein [Streptomyces sp. NRRL F-2580]|uniref:hypothetical protein n=1 Tax=Streptomyces sp. NRRL F-2580 TaxID=1463841 RepID=UPI0004CB1E74|nr:hypothetical protein [Streptomyces sp. NRRL F-2580]